MKTTQTSAHSIRAFSFRIIALTLLLCAALAAQAQTLPQAQEEMLDELTQILRENPEVIGQLRESLREYADSKNRGAQRLKDYRPWLQDTERHPAMGAHQPELTIIVFNDYNCPYCKRLEPVLQQLLAEFDQVQVVHIILPLRQQQVSGLDTNATFYALNVWRNAPEKFDQVHEMLMDRSGVHNRRSLTTISEMTETERWLGSSEALEADVMEAQQIFRNLGLQGTPSLIVGDQIVPGYLPYDRLKPLVEQALSQSK
jgi:protein-disulfide isomerase